MTDVDFKIFNSIAVFGGTFDPVHYGHLVAANEVMHAFSTDGVIFIPAGMPSHKDSSCVTDNELRLEMTKIATSSNPRFFVSRMEIERGGPSYTIDTVSELKRLLKPNAKIYFVVGADSIFQVFSWKDARRLITMCEFIGVTRPGYNKGELYERIKNINQNCESNIHFCEIPSLDISSSEIRERVKEGKSIKYLVPEGVEEYIYKKGLYR
ncbi:MAG: nicotinate-nucleotide adenylyltransferase [Lachnospiraceae bacterium]|nr:nicotinate-nucleotide adenylyltransferase [Lachnospiraceae bacterium]